MLNSSPVGRLAPSPTGLLHLGNAWAFLLAWLACRSQGGRLVLRIEDLDPRRSKPGYVQELCTDLKWLGLDWDEGFEVGGSSGPYVQSMRSELYLEAIEKLRALERVYPCFCTRKELKSLAAAPHAEDIGPVYPGTCRHLSPFERDLRIAQGAHYALRLLCGTEPLSFEDRCYGPQTFFPEQWGGDFVLERSDGVIAYQLAVALDDALMGVNQVVRGRDILYSTPKQLLLLKLLQLPFPQEYAHIPLLLDEHSERLAKRHQSLSLKQLRACGVRPTRIIGVLAYLAALIPKIEDVTPAELLTHFDYSLLPKHDRMLSPDLLSCLQS